MASSNGGSDTPKAEELHDIVFDMLIKGESKEDILNSLEESGLETKEAGKVFEKVKEDYEGYIGSRLDKQVEKSFEKYKEDIMDRIDSKLNSFQRDIKTKRELGFSEQKEYINKRSRKVERRVDEIQDQLFSFRAETKSKIQEISKMFGEAGPGETIRKAFSIIIILAGVLMIAYPAIRIDAVNTLLKEEISKGIISIVIQILLVFAGIMLVKYGKDIYSSSRKKLKEIGQEWVE